MVFEIALPSSPGALAKPGTGTPIFGLNWVNDRAWPNFPN
jgi:hypothetical protein